MNSQPEIRKIKLVNGQARIYHHQKIIDIMKLYETYHHAIRNYNFVVTITGLVCMPYTLQHLTELLHPKGIISYRNYSTLMEDSTIGSHELVNVYLHDSLVLTEQGNAVVVSFQNLNLLEFLLHVVLIRIKLGFLFYNEG